MYLPRIVSSLSFNYLSDKWIFRIKTFDFVKEFHSFFFFFLFYSNYRVWESDWSISFFDCRMVNQFNFVFYYLIDYFKK